jgi:hypothetical protein
MCERREGKGREGLKNRVAHTLSLHLPPLKCWPKCGPSAVSTADTARLETNKMHLIWQTLIVSLYLGGRESSKFGAFFGAT